MYPRGQIIAPDDLSDSLAFAFDLNRNRLIQRQVDGLQYIIVSGVQFQLLNYSCASGNSNSQVNIRTANRWSKESGLPGRRRCLEWSRNRRTRSAGR